jgi:hypothetical protein
LPVKRNPFPENPKKTTRLPLDTGSAEWFAEFEELLPDASRLSAAKNHREMQAEFRLVAKTLGKSPKIWRTCKILGKLTKI